MQFRGNGPNSRRFISIRDVIIGGYTAENVFMGTSPYRRDRHWNLRVLLPNTGASYRFARTALPFLLLLVPVLSPAQGFIAPEDVAIEQGADGGYHLWVRKTDTVASVLITESTADPERKEPVYALRDPEYHPINGDEKRMLDGEFLDTSTGLYSLVDSTPEYYEPLGDAFHIYLPYVAVYGYPWSRSGEIQILDGTWLNIRTFPLPYAD